MGIENDPAAWILSRFLFRWMFCKAKISQILKFLYTPWVFYRARAVVSQKLRKTKPRSKYKIFTRQNRFKAMRKNRHANKWLVYFYFGVGFLNHYRCLISAMYTK